MKRDRTIKRADLNPDACPECGNVNIEGDSVDIEGHGARQGVGCEDCGAVWHDVYQLVRRHVYPDAKPGTEGPTHYLLTIEE
jgi:hypothetical protein